MIWVKDIPASFFLAQLLHPFTVLYLGKAGSPSRHVTYLAVAVGTYTQYKYVPVSTYLQKNSFVEKINPFHLRATITNS